MLTLITVQCKQRPTSNMVLSLLIMLAPTHTCIIIEYLSKI